MLTRDRGWRGQWEAFPKMEAVEKALLPQAYLKCNTDFILINKSREHRHFHSQTLWGCWFFVVGFVFCFGGFFCFILTECVLWNCVLFHKPE